MKLELIRASAVGESPIQQLNFGIFCFVKKPKGILPFGIESSFEVFFFFFNYFFHVFYKAPLSSYYDILFIMYWTLSQPRQGITASLWLLEKPSVKSCHDSLGEGCVHYGTSCWEFWRRRLFVILLWAEEGVGVTCLGSGALWDFSPAFQASSAGPIDSGSCLFLSGVNSNLVVQDTRSPFGVGCSKDGPRCKWRLLESDQDIS